MGRVQLVVALLCFASVVLTVGLLLNGQVDTEIAIWAIPVQIACGVINLWVYEIWRRNVW